MPPNSYYYKQLDGLRFVAVLLVLIEHFAGFIGSKITAGAYGVDLFFVISGFLITGILIKSKESFSISYKKFLGRRSLRIFPLYYLVILILFLLNYKPVEDALLYLLTYTYNYATVAINLPISNVYHFWSLCVEEQFYLFWPIIVLSLRRFPKVFYIFLVVMTTLCYLQMSLNVFPAITPYNLVGLFPRGGSILLGAIGAVLYKKELLIKSVFTNIYFEVIVITILCLSLIGSYQFKFIVLGCCSLYFILKAVTNTYQITWLGSFLSNKTVVYLGTISYGIYIFHLPLGYYFIDRFFIPKIWTKIDFHQLGYFSKLEFNSWIFTFPILMFLSIALAGVSYKFFELPIIKLKDRYFSNV